MLVYYLKKKLGTAKCVLFFLVHIGPFLSGLPPKGICGAFLLCGSQYMLKYHELQAAWPKCYLNKCHGNYKILEIGYRSHFNLTEIFLSLFFEVCFLFHEYLISGCVAPQSRVLRGCQLTLLRPQIGVSEDHTYIPIQNV